MTREDVTLREVLLAESYKREIDALKLLVKELESAMAIFQKTTGNYCFQKIINRDR